MKQVAYYKGCLASLSAKELDISTQALAPKVGLELVELERVTCCGAGDIHEAEPDYYLHLNARILAYAAATGSDTLMTVCNVCTLNLRQANHQLLNDPALRERVNDNLEKVGAPRYESLQPLYNLSDRREFETEFAPICRQEKLGVINYYSLAAGFLTGKYRSAEEGAKHPGRGGRLKRYLDARGMRILKALDTVAARHNALPAQVAIAWLIAKPIITAPIASATSRKQLEEIIKAPDIKLSREDIAALDAGN